MCVCMCVCTDDAARRRAHAHTHSHAHAHAQATLLAAAHALAAAVAEGAVSPSLSGADGVVTANWSLDDGTAFALQVCTHMHMHTPHVRVYRGGARLG